MSSKSIDHNAELAGSGTTAFKIGQIDLKQIASSVIDGALSLLKIHCFELRCGNLSAKAMLLWNLYVQ